MNPFAHRLAAELETGWRIIARTNQLPPEGDWSIWLLLAGRGFGKTRVLSEMANIWASSGQAKRIAIVAATAADARDVIVEGESRNYGDGAAMVSAGIPERSPSPCVAERRYWDALFCRGA